MVKMILCDVKVELHIVIIHLVYHRSTLQSDFAFFNLLFWLRNVTAKASSYEYLKEVYKQISINSTLLCKLSPLGLKNPITHQQQM